MESSSSSSPITNNDASSNDSDHSAEMSPKSGNNDNNTSRSTATGNTKASFARRVSVLKKILRHSRIPEFGQKLSQKAIQVGEVVVVVGGGEVFVGGVVVIVVQYIAPSTGVDRDTRGKSGEYASFHFYLPI